MLRESYSEYTHKYVHSDGVITYKLFNFIGPFHREDGPAYIWPDGRKEWWIEGRLHRLDGPAIIQLDGIEYCIYNRRNNEDEYIKYLLEQNHYQETTTGKLINL